MAAKNDSLSEFHKTAKKTEETYSSFAHRLLNLYSKGMNLESGSGSLSKSDQKTVVNRVCQGINPPDARTLRLTATYEELENVLLIAKRAQRLNHDSVSRTPIPITQESIGMNAIISKVKESKNMNITSNITYQPAIQNKMNKKRMYLQNK